MSKRQKFIVHTLILAVCAFFISIPAFAKYPERPITLIVPWGAGGGTDSIARMVASLMEDELGQPVVVINKTGGSGAVGHEAIARAKPDGYTIGLATLEITTMHWMGYSKLTSEDLTALGQVNFSPAAITVRADAPFKNIDEFIEAVREKPKKYIVSGGGAAAIPHIAAAGMLIEVGLDPHDALPWVSAESAAAAQQEMIAGGVDVVANSLGEVRALTEAGKERSLAVMADERMPGFEDVPTLKESGIDWSYATWRGLVGPNGMPDDVIETLRAAVDQAYHSDEFKEFMTKRGFGMKWRNGPDFAAFMAKQDKVNGKLLGVLGFTD